MADEHGNKEVSIFGINGDPITTSVVGVHDTVWKVKQHVEDECGFPPFAQKLLQQGALLEDDVHLASLPDPPLSLTLVLVDFDVVAACQSAVAKDREGAARALLGRALRDAGGPRRLLWESCCTQGSALCWAAHRGHGAVCRQLLAAAAPASPEACLELLECQDSAALRCAVTGGHETICQLLLDALPGQEPRDRLLAPPGRYAKNALYFAVSAGHEATCRWLLGTATLSPEARCRMLVHDEHIAMRRAAKDGHAAICRLILGAAPSAAESAGMLAPLGRYAKSTLHLAVEEGHGEVCRLLLGAAASHGRGMVCGLLFDTVPIPQQQGLQAPVTFAGKTALHAAADCGHGEICRMLCEAALEQKMLREMLELPCRGGGGSLQADRGLRARDLALRRGHEGACRALLLAAGEGLEAPIAPPVVETAAVPPLVDGPPPSSPGVGCSIE